jgi:hypothetical protein
MKVQPVRSRNGLNWLSQRVNDGQVTGCASDEQYGLRPDLTGNIAQVAITLLTRHLSTYLFTQ